MGSRRAFLGSAFGIAATVSMLLTGCGLTDRTPDYRYRLTVEVDTPQGVRSGSSVIEVQTSVASEYAIPSPGAVSHRVRGEAVAVDLPNGRTLFALLRSDNDIDWASRAMFMLAPDGPRDAKDSFVARYDNLLRLKGTLVLPRTWPPQAHLSERSAYPMLVTFADERDPASVTEVDPDDLAASFGAGVKLRRITVALTDDPVTTGIERRLGWLGKVYDMNLRTEDFPEEFPVGDFVGLFMKRFD